MRDDPDSPGYGGRGLTINKEELSPAERERYDQSYEKFKVNEYASNLIPLRRTLINVTEPDQTATYDLDKLPTAGVVVVFHNEAWSILLRTVHSILGASSPQLLTEIVLVDDASTMEHLGRQLDDYVDLLDKVKLVRLKQHSGIMQARMAGFHQVTGAVAAFLDSHCEVPEGWLPPLLERVRQDENVLAVPVIDTINTDTFQYHATHAKHQMRAGFDLDLSFMWIPQLPEENARRGSPFEPMSFDYGDVSDRVALRQQLGCKSFDWYLKNAYPDMYIPRDIQASGQV
nr:hypothetical protein BaRGS_018509 [Batillaria attramentaria]